MTEKCIAPSSRGSQTTGLDNMTIIIVTLQPHKLTSKLVHEPLKKVKTDEKSSEPTTNGESVAENGDSQINGKKENGDHTNGVSDTPTLTNGKEEALHNEGGGEVHKSDLKRPIESTFVENGDAQNCKVQKTE